MKLTAKLYTYLPLVSIALLAVVASADVEVEEENNNNIGALHAPSADECDINGQGCAWDEWCDETVHPRKCWRRRNNGEQCNRDEK